MKKSVKVRKIFATITDLFIFSVLVRLILFGCYYFGGSTELSLFFSLFLAGFINYVLIPLLFNKQTLGMRLNGLIYRFTKSSTRRDALILTARFLSQLLLNIVLLGIPLAVNLFFLIWRKDGTTTVDQLFSRAMINQELG